MSRQVWAAKVTVKVGEYHVGVKASDSAVMHAISVAMSDFLVDDPDAPTSHAIQAMSANLPGSRPLYRVYEECNPVFVTESLERAVAVLAGYLEGLLSGTSHPLPQLLINAAAILGYGRAIIVPWSLPYVLPAFERRVTSLGIRLLESPTVCVDTQSSQLLVRPSRLLSGGPLDAGPVDSSTAIGTPATPAGHWPVAGWVFHGVLPDSKALTRAQATARGLSLTYAEDAPALILEALATLIQSIEVQQVAELRDVEDSVLQLLSE